MGLFVYGAPKNSMVIQICQMSMDLRRIKKEELSTASMWWGSHYDWHFGWFQRDHVYLENEMKSRPERDSFFSMKRI